MNNCMFYLAFLPVFLAIAGANCPDGWDETCSTCLKIGPWALKYEDAAEHCAENGGRLAVLKTEAQSDCINQYLDSFGYAQALFIGTKREVCLDNMFYWSDGSVATWMNWSPGEPTRGPGITTAARILRGSPSSRKWGDRYAHFHQFLCERKGTEEPKVELAYYVPNKPDPACSSSASAAVLVVTSRSIIECASFCYADDYCKSYSYRDNQCTLGSYLGYRRV